LARTAFFFSRRPLPQPPGCFFISYVRECRKREREGERKREREVVKKKFKERERESLLIRKRSDRIIMFPVGEICARVRAN